MAHFLNHKLTLLFFNFLIFFSITITITSSTNGEFKQENFAKSIITTRTEKTTHLHFYFQDIHSGKNPTAIEIIEQKMGFGTTFIMNDALTEKPELDSKIIGRAQGMYSQDSQNDLTLLMVATFVFTEGEYNGSTISMLGRNHVMDNVREIPIVGGSGLFRFAKGYALAHTIVFDIKTGDATVEYNVFVQHSSDGQI